MSVLRIPEMSLVVLVGASASGKSTFAARHFEPTEILSSDTCRGLVSDDIHDQSATEDAFDALHHLASLRLKRGRLTVIDATNVQQSSRTTLVAIARRYHVLPVAIVINPPQSVCLERHEARTDRDFGRHVIIRHLTQLRSSLGSLRREGFRQVYVLDSVEAIEQVQFERTKLYNDQKDQNGPFDLIGDVHGCAAELRVLLGKLGYELTDASETGSRFYAHPTGRRAIFVGDLVDRGPGVVEVLDIVREMVHAGTAFCVMGNHDFKLNKALSGARVNNKHGLQESLDQINSLPEDSKEQFTQATRKFLDSLVSHYVFDGGKLVVAHAGLKESMQGRASGAVRNFCMYGETTGLLDENGLPERIDWAVDYRGGALVVYGHTPVAKPRWLNNTVNIDTGCVFGGKLTALRYPERDLVTVQAEQTYCESQRDFLSKKDGLSAQQQADRLLDLSDCVGKQRIHTELVGLVTIDEANTTAALETITRFATDPRWLIYLPPTMSPCETSQLHGYLEHPSDAFAHYQRAGIASVVCQQKHMGSRAIVVLCRNQETALARFGMQHEAGCVVTRTGRRFFDDAAFETKLLDQLREACQQTDFWSRMETDWVCLDCELMPWSVKASQLIRQQYAAVGAAGRVSLGRAETLLNQASTRLPADTEKQQAASLLDAVRSHRENVDRMAAAYRPYCWPVESVDDLRLAPFHIMATEQGVHVDRDHLWHMREIGTLCEAATVLYATEFRVVNLSDEQAKLDATQWWEQYTSSGGEGMVVKPQSFVARDAQGRLVQPAVKCRGKEYLRIIYGPNYDQPETLKRLRNRGLGRKRSLATREFSLGIEGLERFVNFEPLRKVHQCALAVLALESEPVDPRL